MREIDLTKGELQALERVDGLYQRGKWRDASKAYASFAQNSRYAATKVAECFFLMQNYDKAKAWYRVLAQETRAAEWLNVLKKDGRW